MGGFPAKGFPSTPSAAATAYHSVSGIDDERLKKTDL
jgi:hypothetical protein